MTEKQIKDVLTAIGISSSVVILVIMIGAAFMFYKNYLETQKLKLQISFLQKTLAAPGQVAQANPMEGSYKNSNSNYGGAELDGYRKNLPTHNPYERIKM